jgi:hypothetical protein
MRTIVWWTVWGLVLAVVGIGLLEAPRNHFLLLLAVPLLTGAAAAALLRIEYEYHHALQHAKWLGVSSLLLLGGMGILYMKAHASGPFATGSAHKAILGATFEMSLPEVERALDRKLVGDSANKTLQDSAHGWVLEALSLPGLETQESYSLPISIYRFPCQASFQFLRGKLGKVRLDFEPMRRKESAALLERVTEDLHKDYKPVPDATLTYEKESVRMTMALARTESGRSQVSITLQYLPFISQEPPPVSVEANVF